MFIRDRRQKKKKKKCTLTRHPNLKSFYIQKHGAPIYLKEKKKKITTTTKNKKKETSKTSQDLRAKAQSQLIGKKVQFHFLSFCIKESNQLTPSVRMNTDCVSVLLFRLSCTSAASPSFLINN